MKQLYLLMLLFTGLTGFASPPVINNPVPYEICDTNYDGFGVFDLTIKIPEVLGSLNPTLYTVSFYDSQTDALSGNAGGQLAAPASYVNVMPAQTIWIRVQENATTEFSVTSLQLVVDLPPQLGRINDLWVPSNSPTDHPAFDFTDNYPGFFPNGQTGFVVSFYTSEAEALSASNAINSISIVSYAGSDGDHIWARVQNQATGCFVITNFYLRVFPPGAAFIPDPDFRAALLSSNPTNDVAINASGQSVSIDANGNGIIETYELTSIQQLILYYANIHDLTGIRLFPNLNQLNCTGNHLTTLDLSNIPMLAVLLCSNNELTSLNLTNSTSLFRLFCDGNHLTSLNLTGMANMNELACGSNQLAALDISDLTSVRTVNCQNNNMTLINLGNLPELAVLECNDNRLTSLDVSLLPSLGSLQCYNNQLTSLDTNSARVLQYLDCDSNQLESLFLKNGTLEQTISFANNPGLRFVCADDNQVQAVQGMVTQNGQSAIVNSYCSFSPGGSYNTISASVKFDANNNGCDVNDNAVPLVRLDIFDQTNSGSGFTDANGIGQFFTQAGNFTVTPILENPNWFTVSPANVTIPFSTTDNNTAGQNFCIAPSGTHPDLEILIAPLISARPGFDAEYRILVRNKGNQAITQTGDGIVFLYDSTKMSLVETSVPVSLILGPPGTLNWDLINLLPFETTTITVKFHINTPTDTVPVNDGDILTFTATANPIDETPTDNTFDYHQTVVNSMDPNEIVCLEGNIVSPIEIGNYLHYTINFENTGTADAVNVVVRDVIDTTQFDLSSLQLLYSSASVTPRITGNIAEFIFPSINLHSGGHGNILLKIRSNTALHEGDTVSKRANIYFDYNFPVATAAENTTFQALSNPNIPVDASISVYPNPSKGTVNIKCNNMIKSIGLFDVQGRLLQTSLTDQNQTLLDISGQSNGIYFVKIISDKGMSVQKVVKE